MKKKINFNGHEMTLHKGRRGVVRVGQRFLKRVIWTDELDKIDFVQWNYVMWELNYSQGAVPFTDLSKSYDIVERFHG